MTAPYFVRNSVSPAWTSMSEIHAISYNICPGLAWSPGNSCRISAGHVVSTTNISRLLYIYVLSLSSSSMSVSFLDFMKSFSHWTLCFSDSVCSLSGFSVRYCFMPNISLDTLGGFGVIRFGLPEGTISSECSFWRLVFWNFCRIRFPKEPGNVQWRSQRHCDLIILLIHTKYVKLVAIRKSMWKRSKLKSREISFLNNAFMHCPNVKTFWRENESYRLTGFHDIWVLDWFWTYFLIAVGHWFLDSTIRNPHNRCINWNINSTTRDKIAEFKFMPFLKWKDCHLHSNLKTYTELRLLMFNLQMIIPLFKMDNVYICHPVSISWNEITNCII